MKLKHRIYAWTASLTAGGTGIGLLVLPPAWKTLLLVGLVVLVTAVLALFAAARSFGMNVGEFLVFVISRAVLALFKATAVLFVELPLRAVHRLWVRYDLAMRLELLVYRFIARPVGGWLRRAAAWCVQGLPAPADAVAVLRRRPLPRASQPPAALPAVSEKTDDASAA